jgi:hypothetical protein
VLNVEYRSGTLDDRLEGNIYECVQRILALYRAAQDARGAVRSIIKREQLHNTQFPDDPYRININNIFLGGASAGSVLSLLTAYYTTQSLINAAFPTGINSTNVLGPIDADYYYGEPTIEYKSKIKGVLNMWGQVLLPPGFSLSDIQGAATLSLPPMISFQGQNDEIFPPETEAITYSPNNAIHAQFNNTDQCLLSTNSFSLGGNNTTPDKTGWGTLSFSEYLASNGVAVERLYRLSGRARTGR